MRKTNYILLICLVWCGLSACESTPEPAKVYTFDTFCQFSDFPAKGTSVGDIEKWKQKHQTRVALEGYLNLPTMFGLASTTFGLDLTQEPGGNRKEAVTVYFKLGSGKNKLKTPPKQYKPDDLEAYDLNGNKVTNKTKVRVHGQRSLVNSLENDKVQSCFINVDRVEIIQ
ncbi:MAG TPA: hypothetical protein DCM08_06470 [Microscillaceae bacterium]|nr:hypothetical protein [Microscillaceae bacterium]